MKSGSFAKTCLTCDNCCGGRNTAMLKWAFPVRDYLNLGCQWSKGEG